MRQNDTISTGVLEIFKQLSIGEITLAKTTTSVNTKKLEHQAIQLKKEKTKLQKKHSCTKHALKHAKTKYEEASLQIDSLNQHITLLKHNNINLRQLQEASQQQRNTH